MKNPKSLPARVQPYVLLTVAAGLLLTSCTNTATSTPTGTGSDPSSLAYINSLRGENDLAHGSLELPAQTNLPGYAASVALQRKAGAAPSEASDTQLKELATQTGDDSSWSVMYLCTITGNNATRVKQVLRDQANTVIQNTQTLSQSLTDENTLAQQLSTIQAKQCLGGSKELAPQPAPAELDKIGSLTKDNPLLAVRAKMVFGASVSSSISSRLNTSTLVPQIESQLGTDGCQGWVWATAAALKSISASRSSPKVESCASNTSATVKESAALQYVVDSGLTTEAAKQLLVSNEGDIKRWTTLGSTTLSEQSQPVGLGTLQYTRDAISYLRLKGVQEYPSWMKNGVTKASETIASSTPQEDKFDLLFSCTALGAACKQSALDDAKAALTKQLASFTPAPKYDLALARAIDTAAEIKLTFPERCASAPANWITEAPQVLAALLAGNKECKKVADVGVEKLKSYYSSGLTKNDYESALGYVLIESLISTQHDELVAFGAFATKEFDQLVKRISAGQGKDFVTKIRPIRLELAKAKLAQWTS